MGGIQIEAQESEAGTRKRKIMYQMQRYHGGKKWRASNCTLFTVKNFQWSLQAGWLLTLLPFSLY